MGFWDGRTKLFSRGKFPTGLLLRVCRALHVEEIEAEIIDTRVKPEINYTEPLLGSTELRDYQAEAVAAVLDNERGVISLPSAAGKTNIAAAIISTLGQPRTLVLVHRKDLMYQLYESFSKYFSDVGMVGDGKRKEGRITIATWQSVPAGSDVLDVDLLILDEAHNAASEKYYEVALSSNAYFRYGLSASADLREDKRDMFLTGLTGEIIYKRKPSELSEWLSIPVVHVYSVDQPEIPHDATYPEAYKLGVTRNEYRNLLVCELGRKYSSEGESTLILVREVEHGRTLSKMMNCPFVYGESSTDDRLSETRALRSGSRQLLIASVVFNEGIDWPDLKVLIVAGGGQSTIQTLQRVGRVMRKKQFAGLVIDFDDKTHKYLQKHTRIREKDYEHRLGAKVVRKGSN
jgi:superfamily II DNA or RNA helicase